MDGESESELDGPRGEQIREACTLLVSEEAGFVHDTVKLKGINLPANEELSVVWKSVSGTWRMRDGNQVIGPQYSVRRDELFTVTTDESRTFTRDWRIEEDYGGKHTFELWAGDDIKLDSASFRIHPYFDLDRTEAPLGEWFDLVGYGLGTDTKNSLYQVTYDGANMGVMTGVSNRGTASARIRAAGPPGEHVIQVWRNFTGIPLLQAHTQTPGDEIAGGRPTTWTVTVDAPKEDPPTMETESMFPEEPIDDHIPGVNEESDAHLGISPTFGRPGTDAIITGRNFPPETAIELEWYTQGGDQITGAPIGPSPRSGVLPTVRSDEEGTFQVDISIPTDIGATRPILAAVNGKPVASTGFVMQPKAVDISPTAGPVGTEITVSITGVGWQSFENQYFVFYDNKPMGYVVSDLADSEGVIRFSLRASGEPGYHFIDLVPMFHDTESADIDLDQKPHLSYVDNHPGRPLPGLNFAFELTDE